MRVDFVVPSRDDPRNRGVYQLTQCVAPTPTESTPAASHRALRNEHKENCSHRSYRLEASSTSGCREVGGRLITPTARWRRNGTLVPSHSRLYWNRVTAALSPRAHRNPQRSQGTSPARAESRSPVSRCRSLSSGSAELLVTTAHSRSRCRAHASTGRPSRSPRGASATSRRARE